MYTRMQLAMSLPPCLSSAAMLPADAGLALVVVEHSSCESLGCCPCHCRRHCRHHCRWPCKRSSSCRQHAPAVLLLPLVLHSAAAGLHVQVRSVHFPHLDVQPARRRRPVRHQAWSSWLHSHCYLSALQQVPLVVRAHWSW